MNVSSFVLSRWLILLLVGSGIHSTHGQDLSPAAPSEILIDFDDGSTNGWHYPHGDWVVRNGRIEQTDDEGSTYRFAIFDFPVEEGSIELDAVALGKNKNNSAFASFGVMWKYRAGGNWGRLRLGSWKIADVHMRIDEEAAGEVKLGPFQPEIGRTYRIKVVLQGDNLVVAVDDVVLTVVRDLHDGLEGKFALFTESPAAFDNIRITRNVPESETEDDPIPPDSPGAYKKEFISYRPDLFPSGGGLERFSLQGTAFIYVRNVGHTPATLEHFGMAGTCLEELVEKGRLSWVIQKPYRINPGEVGEITVRFGGVTPKQAVRMLNDAGAEAVSYCTIKPDNGDPLRTTVVHKRRPDPYQVNFIGFGEDRKEIYAYLQRNMSGKSETYTPFVFESVELNGVDVTRQTTFGAPEVKNHVVPLYIRLANPLPRGREAVLTVRSSGGMQVGLAIKAIPSRVPLVLAIFNQERPDFLKDIYRHGMNTILRLVSPPSYEDVKTAGFPFSMKMTGPTTRDTWTTRIHEATNPETKPELYSVWVDEVDKDTVAECIEGREIVEKHFADDATIYPLHIYNVMDPWNSGGLHFLGVADGSTHAYGLQGSGGGANGKDFPLIETLPWREYRTTRMPFWPYFRTGEISLFVDKTTMTATHPNPHTQRVIDPREQRFLTYGLVQLGAKGFLHWLYGYEWGENHLYYTDGTQIRVSLGALDYPRTNRIHGVRIPDEYALALKEAWDELGRLNAELEAIAPWLARSDVDPSLARVVRTRPESAVRGGAAAQVVTLVSGLDTLLVVVLNLNLDSPMSWESKEGFQSYDPVDVDVQLDRVPWLDPKDIFAIDLANGVHKVKVVERPSRLYFRLPAVQVQKVIVVTSDESVRGRMASTLAKMEGRLGDIARDD